MKTWQFYTSNEIKPGGWLRRQLEIQARGLSGNLDKVWPDVRDSAWVGGRAEGWERVPYWLDGFIPLAYLLEDEDMISRAKRYIDAMIACQRPSGWICPCADEDIPTYDSWAVQLISKVLTVYYQCSRDERIPDVLCRVLKNYYDLLSDGTIKLFCWGKSRWFETFIALDFLRSRYNEAWIGELGRILKEQGADYPASAERWKKPLSKAPFDTHIVNIAMMLKYEALSHDILGEEYRDIAEEMLDILKNFNGTPVGLFTGDEHLSGLSPIQGTELCSVAEQMYSYEWLYAVTGDSKWAERLEVVAFNALPATITDDMWAHQYDQLSNQIAAYRFPSKPIFGTNGRSAMLFGLEPNYGCCTANFNQAWPKFALSAFMHNKNRIVSAVPLPSSLKSESANVELVTNYPFENSFEYRVEAKEDTELVIRIPSFAKSLKVNGESRVYTAELTFAVKAGEREIINIEYETSPELFDRPHDLKSVRCGSLVFSLPVKYTANMQEYERDGVERKFPYCDYEFFPASDWNYAFASCKFELEARGVGEYPFSSERPPVVLKTKMKKIPWGLEEGYEFVCAKLPHSRDPISEEEDIELYPYGCAKLRMTEMPLI